MSPTVIVLILRQTAAFLELYPHLWHDSNGVKLNLLKWVLPPSFHIYLHPIWKALFVYSWPILQPFNSGAHKRAQDLFWCQAAAHFTSRTSVKLAWTAIRRPFTLLAQFWVPGWPEGLAAAQWPTDILPCGRPGSFWIFASTYTPSLEALSLLFSFNRDHLPSVQYN